MSIGIGYPFRPSALDLSSHRNIAIAPPNHQPYLIFRILQPVVCFPLTNLNSQYRSTWYINQKNSSKGKALRHFENLHQSRNLRTTLLEKKLKEKDSDPLLILKEDGDWTKQVFWLVIRFLKQSSRSKEVLQVFDMWKNKEDSRINEVNYEKIIRLLVEEGLVEEAVSAVGEMKSYSLRPSLEVYNSLIRGFSSLGRFEDALIYLKEMEDINLKPKTETYDGLIQAYANRRMYDEMGECVKKMEAIGCLPDHTTYNLLIREYSRAGLLNRMERTNQILISKRMNLQPSTMVSMLEAYANIGIMGKMQKVYRRVFYLKTPLKDGLIRKLASCYIDNYMFSKLDEMGIDLSSKTGNTDMVWCLRMLSHACALSRKGMESLAQEMELERVPWNVTIANIMLLAYLKMKDLKHLKVVLLELPAQYVKPDIVTFGILIDARSCGFDVDRDLSTWRRMGFLDEAVEMNTDPLVFTAFGKGHFLRICEDNFSSLDPKSRKNRVRTYDHLIKLVIEYNKSHHTQSKSSLP